MTKWAIINFARGKKKPYKWFQERLRQSIEAKMQGAAHPPDVFLWTREAQFGSPRFETNPYYFKVAAFEWARKKGYEVVLWLDAPCVVGKPTDDILAHIAAKGYMVSAQSTFNAIGPWTNDVTLQWFGVTRDQVMSAPQPLAGVVGFDFRTEVANTILSKWKEAGNAGLFRDAAPLAHDPKFREHRHDQSSLALVLYTLGYSVEPKGAVLSVIDANDPWPPDPRAYVWLVFGPMGGLGHSGMTVKSQKQVNKEKMRSLKERLQERRALMK